MPTVNYLWNPINDNIIEEFDDAGNTIAEYTTEPDLYGNVVSQFCNGQTSYLLSDGQGNTTELTNDAGNVTDTIRYSAFGQVTQRTGTTEIPFQYVGTKGYFRDMGLGGYSIRRRHFDSANGRWFTIDPLGSLDEPHPYLYVDNNPLLRTDPSGMQATPAKKRCKCPGCDWTFAGASGNLGIVAGYTYARVTARCKKAELRAYRVYTCRYGVTIRKPIHCYCEAKLSFHVPSLGVQVGGNWIAIGGNFKACTDQDISNSVGWNFDLNIVFVGVEGGGDFSGDSTGDYFGGGLAPGLGAAICLNYTFINSRQSSLVCKRAEFNAHERKLERDLGPCTHTDDRLNSPKEVDNPHAIRPPGEEIVTE